MTVLFFMQIRHEDLDWSHYCYRMEEPHGDRSHDMPTGDSLAGLCCDACVRAETSSKAQPELNNQVHICTQRGHSSFGHALLLSASMSDE